MDTEIIHVYTDGSLVRKKDKIYCGYGIYFPNNEYKSISRKFTHEPITNNRAELYAILKSIVLSNRVDEKRRLNNKKRVKEIIIYSDSEYSVKSINVWYHNWIKNGKKYLNQDIIDEIIEHKKNAPFKVTLKHVRSHTGKDDEQSKANAIVDELAKKGAFRND